MEYPERKPNRLKNYDYSNPGAYFITICTCNREEILWQTVGANNVRPLPFDENLSEYGQIVNKYIKYIHEKYKNVSVEKYVIMPNHIHMILMISGNKDGRTMDGRTMFAPTTTVSQIIKQFKGAVTKEIGFSIWQKSFYDHIIRNGNDYENIWEYIESNPQNWQEDCFHID